MLRLDIPGRPTLELEHAIFDFNGTLACDGVLCEGIRERIESLAGYLQVHVVTGNTFGKAAEQLEGLPCTLTILDATGQSEAKAAHLVALDPEQTVCIGNGFNDRLMLEAAAISIVVVQDEGAAVSSLLAADVAVRNIRDAFDILLNPTRLVATLRP